MDGLRHIQHTLYSREISWIAGALDRGYPVQPPVKKSDGIEIMNDDDFMWNHVMNLTLTHLLCIQKRKVLSDCA